MSEGVATWRTWVCRCPNCEYYRDEQRKEIESMALLRICDVCHETPLSASKMIRSFETTCCIECNTVYYVERGTLKTPQPAFTIVCPVCEARRERDEALDQVKVKELEIAECVKSQDELYGQLRTSRKLVEKLESAQVHADEIRELEGIQRARVELAGERDYARAERDAAQTQCNNAIAHVKELQNARDSKACPVSEERDQAVQYYSDQIDEVVKLRRQVENVDYRANSFQYETERATARIHELEDEVSALVKRLSVSVPAPVISIEASESVISIEASESVKTLSDCLWQVTKARDVAQAEVEELKKKVTFAQQAQSIAQSTAHSLLDERQTIKDERDEANRRSAARETSNLFTTLKTQRDKAQNKAEQLKAQVDGLWKERNQALDRERALEEQLKDQPLKMISRSAFYATDMLKGGIAHPLEAGSVVNSIENVSGGILILYEVPFTPLATKKG